VWRTAERVNDIQFGFDVGTGVRMVRSAEAFDLYANGRVFHIDTEKARRLAELERASAPMVRFMVLDYIADASRYVLWLAATIREARGRGWISDDSGS
jgi:hypothetical protein